MTGMRSSISLRVLLAMTIAGSILATATLAQTGHAGTDPNRSGSQPAVSQSTTVSTASMNEGWRIRNATFYKRNWGVDIVGVHLVTSGHMLEFRYRVVDAQKAAPINDKKANAFLIDEKTGTRLTVPVMEKIGQLRQTAEPKSDQTYWMVFANEGKIVRPGDKVDIVIGQFQVNGLIAD
jgi:hypothetical protein